jgi:hypothetical protein
MLFWLLIAAESEGEREREEGGAEGFRRMGWRQGGTEGVAPVPDPLPAPSSETREPLAPSRAPPEDLRGP